MSDDVVAELTVAKEALARRDGYDNPELDDIIDAHREAVREVREQLIDFGQIDDSIAATTEAEYARIRAFQDDQHVTWDQYSYERDEDWRTFNGLT